MIEKNDPPLCYIMNDYHHHDGAIPSRTMTGAAMQSSRAGCQKILSIAKYYYFCVGTTNYVAKINED